MNAVSPFSSIMSSFLDSEGSVKNATGLIRDWQTLIDPEKVEALKENYPGVIVFLAVDKDTDLELFEYIISEQFKNNTGKDILVLFLSNTKLDTPDILDNEELHDLVKVDFGRNVLQETLGSYFKEIKYFSLPGILVFDKKKNSQNGIYIPFKGKESEALDFKKSTQILYESIEISINTYFNSKEKTFLNKLGTELSKGEITYYKSKSLSFSECIVRLYKKLYELKGDIISIVK